MTHGTEVQAVIQRARNRETHEVAVKIGIYVEPAGTFFLVTMHREENVDNGERLRSLVDSLLGRCREYEID